MRWTTASEIDILSDGRGWRKGTRRRYTREDEDAILRLHKELAADQTAYFSGASAIERRYREQYPNRSCPSLLFIGRTLASHGLTQKPRAKQKGAARYLHYPAETIQNLGARLLEIDFIGKKFIRGRTEPINFIGASLTTPRKLKHFKRISGETASEAIAYLTEFFSGFGETDVVKLDNGFGFAGASGRAQRVIGSVSLFLLARKITPVFTAPRKPWNQASIEGANSIFARKFWRRHDFKNLHEIDRALEAFNASYRWYCGFQKLPSRPYPPVWIPRICYIRKVYEDEQTRRGYIELLNDKVMLPPAYINFFVFAEWNLKEQTLSVCFQTDQKRLKQITQQPFLINQKSREKCSHFI